MPGKSDSFVTASLWQMPQASTLIRTWPGPGSGIGCSTRSKAPFGRVTRTVRMPEFLSTDFMAVDLSLGAKGDRQGVPDDSLVLDRMWDYVPSATSAGVPGWSDSSTSACAFADLDRVSLSESVVIATNSTGVKTRPSNVLPI